MLTPTCFSSWSRRALLSVIFCALLAAPLSLAQAAPPAGSPQQPPALQSASTGDFLASLSTPSAPAGDATSTLRVPAPAFLSGCTSNAQCPTGQLCCLACGFPDCDAHACFQPIRGHCPFFP